MLAPSVGPLSLVPRLLLMPKIRHGEESGYEARPTQIFRGEIKSGSGLGTGLHSFLTPTHIVIAANVVR